MTEQQRSDISNLGKSTAMERLAGLVSFVNQLTWALGQCCSIKGRGLFMDPPSVFMSNNMWSLLLPEGFQIENLKLGNIRFGSRGFAVLIPLISPNSSKGRLVFVHVDMDDEDAGKPIASFFGITGNKVYEKQST
ncbi:hypothetical protein AHAS_Ahas18G0062300 [Arachis hypogaea]